MENMKPKYGRPLTEAQYTATADREILNQRVRMLYDQAPPGLAATVVNGIILVAVLWDVQSPRLLSVWLGVLLLITAWRVGLWLAFRRARSGTTDYRIWLRRFAVGAFAVGACWGAAGTVLFPVQLPAYQMFVLTVLAGMSAGAVPLLSSIWIVYAGYAVLMLLPTVGWLFLQEGRVQTYIALMVLLYLGVVLISAARIAKNTKISLQLRYERSDLIEKLSRSKVDLEHANAELAAEANRRLHAQRKLQDNSRFLERVMDSANDGIFVLDREGRFTRVNRAMAQFAGRSRADLQGLHFVDLLSEESRAKLGSGLENLMQQPAAATFDDLDIPNHVGVRCLSVSFAPLQEAYKTEALVGVARDVTEQRELERMKEDFISTVSHELRTPLTSIRGALGLLNRTADTAFDEQTRSLLSIADNNSDRLLRLIDDLLDLQRLTSARMRFQFTDEALAPLVRQAVAINQGYAENYNVSLRLEEPVANPKVRVDRDRFLQVLTNLISNAAKFSTPGSEVRVYTESVELGIRICIADTGPGVPQEFRHKIFQRFSQADSSDSRNKGGTGLGLSISKSLIEAMHGHIGFHSEIGEGSTFYVELPVGEQTQEPQRLRQDA